MKGDLSIERFPAELLRDGKIAAIREGVTWRAFVIAAVAARVAAQAEGAAREQGPGRAPARRR